MKRREFLHAAGAGVAGLQSAPRVSAANEEAIRRAVETYYAAYRSLDKARYLSLLTDDYLLLENGDVLDANGDVALWPSAGGY